MSADTRTAIIHQAAHSIGVAASVERPINPRRNSLKIQNLGTADVYFSAWEGITLTLLNGIRIVAGGLYEPFKAPTGPIQLIAAAGTQNVVIVEGQG